MECNKDEAARAKVIAEKKFESKDYPGAKKIALKAQSLYPGLDGIQDMLKTLDVYIASEDHVNGENDWYRVLDVNPHADEEAIRKQYRQLALILHPDKNKSLGADGAFKLIHEAWNLLSDKSARSLYDQKRNIKTVKPNVASHESNGVGSSNKSTRAPKTAAQKGKATKSNRRTPNSTTSAPPNQEKDQTTPIFWTVCRRCRLQYKYPLEYLHRYLVCPNCDVPFYAAEYAPPGPQIPKMPSECKYFLHKQADSTIRSTGLGPSNQTNYHGNSFSKTSDGPSADEAATATQQALRSDGEVDSKRKRSASKRKAEFSSDANGVKRRRVVEDPKGTKTEGNKMSSSEPDKADKKNKPRSSSDRPNFVITKKTLAERAKLQIKKKLNEWKSADDVVVASSVGNVNKKTVTATGNGKLNASTKGNQKDSELKSISVPDSDFHDFDKDRTETCFSKNQVWAAYDDADGMPRFYAIIRKVVSEKPFKVIISWLNSNTNTEFGPLNWVGSGFKKTCGEFRIGKSLISESLNSFSHKVSWAKGKDGVVSIFPKKGDVWALYRNWSPKWIELTEVKGMYEYDMVEVLEDYDQELGLRVSPLIKVAGFKTVFRRHLDKTETMTVPRAEMFRFSHQVPSVLLSGQEGEKAPKGSRELDPAATPLELLQVLSDSKCENMKGDEGKN